MKSSLMMAAAGLVASLVISACLAEEGDVKLPTATSKPTTRYNRITVESRIREIDQQMAELQSKLKESHAEGERLWQQSEKHNQRFLDQLKDKREKGQTILPVELELEKSILELRQQHDKMEQVIHDSESDRLSLTERLKTGIAPSSQASSKSTSATSKAPTASSASAPAPKNNVASIRMVGKVVEAPPLFSLLEDPSSFMTTRDWLQRLAKARNDKNVQAVMIEIDGFGVSWAQAQEIADGVRRLAETKPVYTYVIEPSAAHYLIASAGTEVDMDPAGCVMITGLAAEMTYFRSTLEKIGVKPQMIQVGKFKGAAEPFTNDKPSQEVVAMYNWLLDDLYEQLCLGIADNRHLKLQDAKDAVDNGPFCGADALKYKLVDKLIDRIDWRSYVEGQCKKGRQDCSIVDAYAAKDKAAVDMSNPFAIINILLKGPPRDEPRDPTIAMICADGVIVSGRSREGMLGGKMMGSVSIVEAFQEVTDDDRVKAVVFRVDSPGGSAIASEMIYQAVRKCAQVKPVIVSIASVGGSGGYYISLGGTSIVADPSAIVGSVGVVSGKLAAKGLMDKLGVSTYEITRGKNAGIMLSREWDDRELTVMTRLATKTYELFVERVKAGRKDKIKDYDKVLEGRVFTARQAAANGLIDKVGGIKEAFQLAQDAAKIKDAYYTITLPRPRGLADMLAGMDDSDTDEISPGPANAAMQEVLLKKALQAARTPDALPYMMNLLEVLGQENVLAAMPYYLRVSQ